jgi:hypothetical protein
LAKAVVPMAVLFTPVACALSPNALLFVWFARAFAPTAVAAPPLMRPPGSWHY